MMIPYDELGGLRLEAFFPDEDWVRREDWEFQDHVWLGKAFGFSEWLRLIDDPEVPRSLTIDFTEFPVGKARVASETIQVPVNAGMSLRELDGLPGPLATEQRFAAHRVTREYFTPRLDRYRVSCTVLDQGGMSHLVVMLPSIGDDDDESDQEDEG